MTNFWYWKGKLHQHDNIDGDWCYVDKPYEGLFFFQTKENKTRFLELRHILTGKKYQERTSLNALTAHTRMSPEWNGNKIHIRILIRGLDNGAYIVQEIIAKRLMPQKAKQFALDWTNDMSFVKKQIMDLFDEKIIDKRLDKRCSKCDAILVQDRDDAPFCIWCEARKLMRDPPPLYICTKKNTESIIIEGV